MERLDDILADVVAGPTPKLHNAFFFAQDTQGNTYSKAFGSRDVAQTTPATADSVYWVASLTKLATAVAVLIGVERGLVTLDQDVRLLVPELAELEVLEGFDEDGKPRLRKCTTPVTLRQLLSHSSGFAYDIQNPDLQRWAKYVGKQENTFTGSYQGYLYPLVFEPGNGWAYGSGMDWAGRALEVAAQQDLETFMKAHIWTPLSMHSTTFRPWLRPDLLSRRVELAWRSPGAEAGSPLKPSQVPLRMPAADCCGGVGLYSTPADQSKFMASLLAPQHGSDSSAGALLTQASWDELWKPQIADAAHFRAATSGAKRCLFAQLWPEGETGVFGLSSSVNDRAFEGRRGAGSANWQGMPGCQTWIDREKGLVALFLAQVLPPGDPEVTKAVIALEEAVYEVMATGLVDGEGKK